MKNRSVYMVDSQEAGTLQGVRSLDQGRQHGRRKKLRKGVRWLGFVECTGYEYCKLLDVALRLILCTQAQQQIDQNHVVFPVDFANKPHIAEVDFAQFSKMVDDATDAGWWLKSSTRNPSTLPSLSENSFFLSTLLQVLIWAITNLDSWSRLGYFSL